jgi:8-amino-7-oxononanoate synthase
MLDFVSSSYLGLRHGSADLGKWPALTTARPAVLGGAALAGAVAQEIAALQGRETGFAAAATLHLGVDLVTAGLPRNSVLHWDAHLYPVLRCTLPLAGPHLDPAPLPPHDPDALAARLANQVGRPVLVTDGYCIACGRPAPLAAYLDVLRRRGGLLVIDDTQALGIMGTPGPTPFGTGGGGSPPTQRLDSDAPIIVIASLAKAFGVPMAVLSGPVRLIDRIRARSLSRMHCSPPSIPAALAALRALRLNALIGDRLRGRLARLLRLFRDGCRAWGVALSSAFHPVQTIPLPRSSDAVRLAAAAAAAGMVVAPCRGANGAPELRLVVTAAHRSEIVNSAVRILASLLPVPEPSRVLVPIWQ